MLPLAENEMQRLVEECRKLKIPDGGWMSEDFPRYNHYVTNVFLTVLDLQMQNVVVENSIRHYERLRSEEIKTLEDLERALDRYPDTLEGNKAAAFYLWGYNLWKRVEWLRGFVRFLRVTDLTTQEKLKAWANSANFERDFEGRSKFLGIAAFQWLRMRLGVNTVKPDVMVHRFVKRITGRSLSDADAIAAIEEAARRLGVRARDLDGAIWESERGAPGTI